MNDLIPRLTALGLTELEAATYLHLLQQPRPQTAYRIGRDLGRAPANVYSAVETLRHKGAVTVEEGDRRLCRATPPDRFLAMLGRHFERQRRALEADLETLTQQPSHEQVVQLRSADAVLQQSHELLRGAQQIAVIDAFPAVLEDLGPSIVSALDRGVDVRLQVYRQPTQLPTHPRLHIATAHQAEEILHHWQAEQLNLVVDAREAVVALLTPDLEAVLEAVATDLLYLSCMLHAGFLREHEHHLQHAEADRQLPTDALYFHHSPVIGQLELQRRYAEQVGLLETLRIRPPK